MGAINPRAVLGGNSPPLGERLALDHASLVKRAADAVAGVPADLRAFQTEEEAQAYTDQAADLKELLAEADRAFVPEKAPFLEASRTVETFFRFRDEIKAAVGRLVMKLNAHADAKRAAQRKAEADEAERARKEAEAFDEPVLAPAAPIPVREIARVVTESGRKAAAGTKWDFELANIEDVPRQWLIVNKALIDAAIKTGTRAIPGLRIFERAAVSIRR